MKPLGLVLMDLVTLFNMNVENLHTAEKKETCGWTLTVATVVNVWFNVRSLVFIFYCIPQPTV